MAHHPSYTAFADHRLLASGSLASVALALRQAPDGASVLVFDDGTGRSIDIDTRGSEAEVRARFAPATDAEAPADAGDGGASSPPKGRGRPKLGVVAREVTLLPRHWEWLASQPGGASVALRKLVDEARRAHGERDRLRLAQERAYHFMSALAGDLPGFEEAARALFAHDTARFAAQIAGWPADVRDHAARLASGELPAAAPDD